MQRASDKREEVMKILLIIISINVSSITTV